MQRSCLQHLAGMFIALVLPASTVVAQNLLVNGSFESGPGRYERYYQGRDYGAIHGWTVTRKSIDYCADWQCSEGRYCIDLDGNDGDAGGIAQTFSTSPETSYLVTFDLAGNPGHRAGNYYPRVKRVRVTAAGQSADFDFDTTGYDFLSMGWISKTWSFKAASDSTTLEFYSLDSQSDAGDGPALDNVEVHVAIDLVAVGLDWNPTSGGLDARYRVDGGALPTATTAKLFWANGTSVANILPPGTPIVDPKTIPEGTGPTGVTTFNVPAASFANPPAIATHVLLVLDQDGLVTEASEDNNTAFLELTQPDIIVHSVEVNSGLLFVYYEVQGRDLDEDVNVHVGYAPPGPDLTAAAASLKNSPVVTIPVNRRKGGWVQMLNSDQFPPPPAGATHVMAWANPFADIQEASEANNFAQSALFPTVELSFKSAGGAEISGANLSQLYDVIGIVNSKGRSSGRLDVEVKEECSLATVVTGPPYVASFPLTTFNQLEEFSYPRQQTWNWVGGEDPNLLMDTAAAILVDLGLHEVDVNTMIVPLLEVANALTELLHTTPSATFDYSAYATIGNERQLAAQRSLVVSASPGKKMMLGLYVTQRAGLAGTVWATMGFLLAGQLPEAAVCAGIAGVCFKGAVDSHRAAMDPPDPNFTLLVNPQLINPSVLDGVPEGANKDTARAALAIASLNAAASLSRDRADGAKLAGAFDWEVLQASNAANLQIQAGVLAAQITSISSMMPRFSESNRALVRNYVETNGFPQFLTQFLLAAGSSAEAIAALRQEVINSTPTAEHLNVSVSALKFSGRGFSFIGTEDVRRAITVGIEKLGKTPTSLTPEQEHALDNLELAIETGLAGGNPGSQLATNVLVLLTNALSAAQSNWNIETVRTYLEFADAALRDYQQLLSPYDGRIPLVILHTPAGVVISWPATASYRLEATDDLSASIWSAVGVNPTNVGAHLEMELPAGDRRRFFRLTKVAPAPQVQPWLAGIDQSPITNGVTANPVISGSITAGGSVAGLRVAFGGTNALQYVDVTADLSPFYRRFTFDRAKLEQIYGRALSDGVYSLHFEAFDAQNNGVARSDFSFRLDTLSPTVFFNNTILDADTNTPGIQVVEYSTLRFHCGISDAGGVRSLELLMNSNAVAVGSVFPWSDFVLNAPSYAAGSNIFRFQARGTDFAGNVGLSAPMDIEVIPDASNLAVVSAWPANGMMFNNLGVERASIVFNKSITPQSLNPINMAVFEAGPDGQFGGGDDLAVDINSLLLSDDDTVVSLLFPALPTGRYQIRLSANGIFDRASRAMGIGSLALTEFRVNE